MATTKSTKTKYSFKTGFWKSVKNTFVVLIVPALFYAINGWQEWVPAEYYKITLPFFGFIGYLIKNYHQVKQ